METQEDNKVETNEKKRNFVHLHLHTLFSALDGAIKIEKLAESLKEKGMDMCAITDHGVMYGIIDFYKTMKKYDIKPIIGSEFYIAPESRHHKKDHYKQGDDTNYHLVLLAENNEGLQNLYKLSSIGFLEGFYRKPRIDKEVLRQHSKGIIALSACLGGEISRKFLKEGYEAAKKAALEYDEILGRGNYYLEIQENGIPEQKIVNNQLIQISKETGIPLVATCDSHYLNKNDYSSHNILMQIQLGQIGEEKRKPRLKPMDASREIKSIAQNDAEGDVNGYLAREDDLDDLSRSTSDTIDPAIMHSRSGKMEYSSMLYVKSIDEMYNDFSYCIEAVENTVEIGKRCNVDITFGVNHLPVYDVPEGYTLKSYFIELAEKGLEERLKKVPKEQHPVYWERLKYELDIIIMKGFDAYFLIVWDFINYARKNNIPVGPGRGSGAGSLVAYSLTITDLDPIRFKLFFERFLNPERTSMPDFDIDFCVRGREEVIKYVTERYGSDRVSQIVTFGTLKPKNAVRDVCRVYNTPLVQVNMLAKSIPDGPSITTFKKAYDADPELAGRFKNIEHGEEIRRHSENLEGLIRQVGIHAAGVVIADKPLVEYAPLAKGPKGEVIVQFEKNAAESVGLIKFDFLGLKNLTIIDEAVKRIHEKVDKDFDVNHLALDDKDVYDMLQRGDTAGVFQLESTGMKNLLKKLRPSVFEDIIAANALYRPGPIDSGMLDSFIRRKHGEEEVIYPFEEIEDILKETYGVIVYQEQVMQIAQVLGGYSLGAADNLRRAMGKKKKEEMEKNRAVFLYGDESRNIPGVEKLGKDVQKASDLYDLIDKFAGYGFNKSHSAAYAYIAYQTAYLKLKYPKEYMSALLSVSIDNIDDVVKYIEECRKMGIKILPPNINKSYFDFRVEDDGIRFGLGAIKSVGEAAITSFIIEREKNGEYKNIYDLCNRMDFKSAANKKTIEAFIYSGALDCFGKSRHQNACVYLSALEQAAGRAKDREKGLGSILDFISIEGDEYFPEVDELPTKELLSREKEILGFYYTDHPLREYKEYIETFAEDMEIVKSMRSENEVVVCGMIKTIKHHITKAKKEKMAFLELEDASNSLEVVVFPKVYMDSIMHLKEDNIIVVRGVFSPNPDDEKGGSLQAKKITTLGKALEEEVSAMVVKFDTHTATSDKLFQIKTLCAMHKGSLPLELTLKIDDNLVHLNVSEEYYICPDTEFIEQLKQVPGVTEIRFRALDESKYYSKDFESAGFAMAEPWS